MDTKLDARAQKPSQAQFPASFPESFKNFFEMMNEDEDHCELFANLLEDKVIPRSGNSMQRHRGGGGGGSLRGSGHGRSRGRGSASGSGSGSSQHVSQQHMHHMHHSQRPHYSNRSNSSADMSMTMAMALSEVEGAAVTAAAAADAAAEIARCSAMHRPRTRRNSFSATGSSCMNRVDFCGILSNGSTSSSGSMLNLEQDHYPQRAGRVNSVGSFSGSGGNLLCRHIRYCCLHQPTDGGQQLPPSYDDHHHQRQLQQEFERELQQQQQRHQLELEVELQQQRMQRMRFGPDGDDNGYSDAPANYVIPRHQQQQQQPSQRPSSILERVFDFDTTCDESDEVNSSLVPSPAPKGADAFLKPILKQPHHHIVQEPTPEQRQQQQLLQEQQMREQEQTADSNQVPIQEESRLEESTQEQQQHPVVQQQTSEQFLQQEEEEEEEQCHHLQQEVQRHILEQQQQQQEMSRGIVHRILPTPPTHNGVGATHTRELVLPRVQQQSGFHAANHNLSGATAISTALSYNPFQQPQPQQQHPLQQQQLQQQQQQQQLHWRMQQDTFLAGSKLHLAYNLEPEREAKADLQNYSRNWNGCNAENGATNTTHNNYGVFLAAEAAAAVGQQAAGASRQSLRAQKSPILNRRRSSSIAANLLHGDLGYARNSIGGATAGGAEELLRLSLTSARERMSLANSPMGRGLESSVLTFQQAMSGAVSPQYAATSGGLVSCPMTSGMHGIIGGGTEPDKCLLGASNSALAAVAEDATTSGPDATDSPIADSSDDSAPHNVANKMAHLHAPPGAPPSAVLRERGVGESSSNASNAGTASANPAPLHGSSATLAAAQYGSRMAERQRLRTSSMPAESRKPRLADTRRAAIHCGTDVDMDYYRLRSFSITSHGVCNLGDSLRSRRSRSINSVTSTGTANSRDRHNSNASRTSGDAAETDIAQTLQPPQQIHRGPNGEEIPVYKIAMLGAAGVGKTTLTYQFTTSEYICAYDLSLDDDYGQKTVSVLVDDIETDLEIIDHPACEMSTEAFCATYNIDLFVVVYSVVDRSTFKAAERVLQYLKENDMLLTRGAILVGNKTDLERHREVTRHLGRKLAKEIACKFIETSSGLDHNVDELLVGIVAQVKLNPQRLRLLTDRERQRLNLQTTIQNHRRMHLPARRVVRQMSICHADEDDANGDADGGTEHGANVNLRIGAPMAPRGQKVRKAHRRTLNLESILKMGESELEDEDSSDANRSHGYGNINGNTDGNRSGSARTMSKFEMLTAGMRQRRPLNDGNEATSSRYDHDNGPSTSAAAAAAAAASSAAATAAADGDYDDKYDADDTESSHATDCNRKVVAKLTTRTKLFITSVLRFKKSLKRRNSSSCSDLFVI